MKQPVLCFGRDKTIDVTKNADGGALPLGWIQFYAHYTDHHTWATENQQLQIEAGIPTPYEAKRILLKAGETVQRVPAGGHDARHDRLRIVEQLYHELDGSFQAIVVDGTNLSQFCERDGWTYHTPESFIEHVRSSRSELPEPDMSQVSDEPYYNTTEHGTYDEMLDRIRGELSVAD